MIHRIIIAVAFRAFAMYALVKSALLATTNFKYFRIGLNQLDASMTGYFLPGFVAILTIAIGVAVCWLLWRLSEDMTKAEIEDLSNDTAQDFRNYLNIFIVIIGLYFTVSAFLTALLELPRLWLIFHYRHHLNITNMLEFVQLILELLIGASLVIAKDKWVSLIQKYAKLN